MAVPLLGLIGSIGSAVIGGIASSAAAKKQAEATRYAADIQRQNFQDTTRLMQPQIDAGNTARGYQLGALGLPGGQGYDSSIAAFRDSPGYRFAVNEGVNATQTSAAAGGRLFSGGTMKALQDRGQGMADQQFGSWFNRLGGLSGAGGTATTNLASFGQSNANNLSNLAVQGGDAQASSYIRGANAITGGIQNLADQYAYYNPPAWAGGRVQGSSVGAPMYGTGGRY